MILLPAIDLLDGRCVRLRRGDFGTAHQVAADPLETARRFQKAGAAWIHLVDLDGAKTGSAQNRILSAKWGISGDFRFGGFGKSTACPKSGGKIRRPHCCWH